MANREFRPDVEGLRGIAVILVVLFHAKLALLPGGYVGVDVFLVISGFLISRLLLKQLDDDGLEVGAFYYRRMRRLVPALVAMVAVVLPAALFILGPRDLQTMAGSAIAALALASNFFFWHSVDYFNARTPEQPLLHTWTLALEEQFYLVFPVCLLSIRNIGRQHRPTVFGSSAVVLFGFAVWLTTAHPGTAFYLLPARAWEFVLGGLTALLAERCTLRPMVRECVTAAGLIGLIASAVCITRATPYPGVAALLPTAATSCVLYANSGGGTLGGRLLELPLVSIIGRASYSLYLWHWPVLTLTRYYLGHELDALQTSVALCVVVIVATLSWLYVEKPFRLGGGPTRVPRPLTPVTALFGAIVIVSVVTLGAQGFPARLPANALAFDRQGIQYIPEGWKCHFGPPQRVAVSDFCLLSHPATVRRKILLWGDSHANAIAPAMAALGTANGAQVWQASYSGCPPVLGTRIAHKSASDHCPEFNETAFKTIGALGIQAVVLVAYWSSYAPAPSDAVLVPILDPFSRPSDINAGNAAEDLHNLATGLRATVTRIQSSGVEVWVVRQIPGQAQFVPLALSRAVMRGQDYSALGIGRDEYLRSQSEIDPLLEQLPSPVRLLDPAAALCRTGLCLMSSGNRALYLDSNHLSPAGAELLEPELRPIFISN